MMGRGKNGKGFTLIEVMVVVGIFSVIMFAIAMTYISGTKLYRQSVFSAQMRMLTQKTMAEIHNDLIDCQLLDGWNFLDRINFQKPTARQNSLGDDCYIDTARNEPFWGDGITELDGVGETHVTNTIQYGFVRSALLREAVDRIDYNRDGDMADDFERGRIVRRIFPEGADLTNPNGAIATRDLTLDWVFKSVLPHGVPPELTAVELAALDIDGINGPDPIFQIIDDDGDPVPTGGRIQVRIFTMQIINRIPVLVHTETVVTPVNKQ